MSEHGRRALATPGESDRETSMKTMLGGWEDIQRVLAQGRAAQPVSAEPFVPVNVRHCVAVPPQDRSSPAATARRFSLRKTRVGGVSVPVPPLPAAPGRLPPRPAARPPAFTRQARRAGSSSTPGGAPLSRWALDETCEIQDVDLVLLLERPVPPQPLLSRPASVALGAAGLRRGGTLVEPALQIIPRPTQGLARFVPSLLRRIAHWAKARVSLG